jgi:drug/metabolite transporter (DMT)-like permease
MFVLDELPAREASMGTLANPVVGVIAAWIQLGERPSLLSGVGMLLVLTGLVLLTLAPPAQTAGRRTG